MTHAEALDGKFLPDLDEEQRKRFTPSELIIYKHAQDYRYICLLYTSPSPRDAHESRMPSSA